MRVQESDARIIARDGMNDARFLPTGRLGVTSTAENGLILRQAAPTYIILRTLQVADVLRVRADRLADPFALRAAGQT